MLNLGNPQPPPAVNESKPQSDIADALAKVELEIARRADELSRNQKTAYRHPLDHWRQAEEEIWLRRWHRQAESRRWPAA